MGVEIVEPDLADVSLETVLQALGDDVRLQVVRELLEDPTERACGTFNVEVSKATRSHHFRTLREAGITHTRSEGTQRMVSLRREELDARFPGLLDAIAAASPAPVLPA